NTLGWSTLRPSQRAAIAPIHAGTHCLLLAPTAGGKTEAAAIPRSTTLAGLSRSRLGRLMRTTTSLAASRSPSGPSAISASVSIT
ncbi:hypothetical protein EO238_29555, partial [Citrobacter sp. AAK_AS5]